MVTPNEFTEAAMALEGVTSKPHFDRVAFRVARNFATLSPDGKTVNLKLTPGDQELKCMMLPSGFSPVSGGWGRQGWTVMKLDAVTFEEVTSVLKMAWGEALPRKKKTAP